MPGQLEDRPMRKRRVDRFELRARLPVRRAQLAEDRLNRPQLGIKGVDRLLVRARRRRAAPLRNCRSHPLLRLLVSSYQVMKFQPPSSARSTPFAAGLVSRKTTPSTISSIVANRPVGVFDRIPSRTGAGL